MTDTLKGQLFALSTAFAWSASTILFKKSGEHFEPLGINYFKNVVALVLFALTMPFAGVSWSSPAPPSHVVLLMVSGAVGIGLADTFFFTSLRLLGAARAAIVDCLYVPFVVLSSMVYLGERPGLRSVAGGTLIVSAVLLTTSGSTAAGLTRRDLWRGIGFGGLAMAFTAVAIVAVKPILPLYPVLWSTSVRLAGGVLGLTLFAASHASGRTAFLTLVPQRTWRVAFPGAVLGAYLALLFWVAGFRYGAASTSAMLNQMSTIVTVALAALFLHERFTLLHALAVALAFGGSVVVMS
jgi:drug/metabolite transporter (DMT)-like permease